MSVNHPNLLAHLEVADVLRLEQLKKVAAKFGTKVITLAEAGSRISWGGGEALTLKPGEEEVVFTGSPQLVGEILHEVDERLAQEPAPAPEPIRF